MTMLANQFIWAIFAYFFSVAYGQNCYQENCPQEIVGYVLAWKGDDCCGSGLPWQECVVPSSLEVYAHPLYAPNCRVDNVCQGATFPTFQYTIEQCSAGGGRKKRSALRQLPRVPTEEEFLKSHAAEIKEVQQKFKIGPYYSSRRSRQTNDCIQLKKIPAPAYYKFYKKIANCCYHVTFNGQNWQINHPTCISVELVSKNSFPARWPVGLCSSDDC